MEAINKQEGLIPSAGPFLDKCHVDDVTMTLVK